MDCSPPGSSVHEIFQARILEWVAISLSRESSRPRVSCTAGRFFINWAAREAIYMYMYMYKYIYICSKLVTTINLVNFHHHMYVLWWELLKTNLSKYQIYNTVLLTMVTHAAHYISRTIWDTLKILVWSLHRSHINLLWIFAILVYVLLKWKLYNSSWSLCFVRSLSISCRLFNLLAYNCSWFSP